jgi:arginine decarboxylase
MGSSVYRYSAGRVWSGGLEGLWAPEGEHKNVLALSALVWDIATNFGASTQAIHFMQSTYADLIRQTFDWPVFGFEQDVRGLNFYRVPLMELIELYGTPFRLTYLPKIGRQIEKARALFEETIRRHGYQGRYYYTYCTKSSHFDFVMREALRHQVHIETSSAYDLDLVQQLYQQGRLSHDCILICNGYKLPRYTSRIAHMANQGFQRVLPVLDHTEELEAYQQAMEGPFDIGLRIATEEEPTFEFYTSRLGIPSRNVLDFYQNRIREDPQVRLKMLHFFISTGIRDTVYYWAELDKCLDLYCRLKKEAPELDSLDIGGGFPAPQSLYFDYSYAYMIEEIVGAVMRKCDEEGVPHPHLYSEFGAYTVAESGAHIYQVAGLKQQNDAELWYMIDGSVLTNLPDTHGLRQRYIVLPVNHWDAPYARASIGGITCDSSDYYNASIHQYQLYLPRAPKGEPLYIGFFHTGAYQEAIGGYGGVQHCLIPAPQHILAWHDGDDRLQHELFASEQSGAQMLHHLGYDGGWA